MEQLITTANVDIEKAVAQYLGFAKLNLTGEEKRVALEVCKLRGLNPLNKDVYITKFKGKMQLMTAYTKFVEMAKRDPNFGGINVSLAQKVKNPFTDKDDIYINCTVFNKDGTQLSNSNVFFSEYNVGNYMWKTKQNVMLQKVSVVSALRNGFGELFQGLYISEEFDNNPESKVDEEDIVQDNKQNEMTTKVNDVKKQIITFKKNNSFKTQVGVYKDMFQSDNKVEFDNENLEHITGLLERLEYLYSDDVEIETIAPEIDEKTFELFKEGDDVL